MAGIALLTILFASWIFISIILTLIQEFFLFHPEKLPRDFEFKFEIPFRELNYDVKPGVRINGLIFSAEKRRGTVIYFHGNTRSIKGWSRFAKDFLRNGYDVMMLDYRGFGKSTGTRSERGINNDLQYVYNRLTETIPEQEIVIYGRSMGTGFATKLASSNNPQMLILESAYYSIADIARRYLFFMPVSLMLRFKVRTYKWIQYVRCPVFLIHGGSDRLVPWRASQRLLKKSGGTARLFLVPGGRHNNLQKLPEYHRILDNILLGKVEAEPGIAVNLV